MHDGVCCMNGVASRRGGWLQTLRLQGRQLFVDLDGGSKGGTLMEVR